MKRRAFITGKSMICSLGDSLEEIIDAVRYKRLKITRIPFDLVCLPYTKPYYLIQRNEMDKLENRSEAHFYDILFSAISHALSDAGLNSAETEDMGIFFGSTSMDVPVFEGNHRKTSSTVSDMFLQSSYGYGKLARTIGEKFNIKGGCYSFATACTSSANALLYASALIAEGRIERALVVGYDLFNNLGFYGFEALKSIADMEYKPFDKTRDGLILGEACGAVVLENRKRRADDFMFLGGANICDIYSVTSHDEEGSAVAETMNRALRQAGIDPADIYAVKAHATGTENNDRTECAAMKATFGRAVPPMTCVKPFIGHTVGACGVNEMILFTESVKAGFVPSTPGFREMDEALDLAPLTENMKAGTGIFMLNYFGFGGNCTTLVLSNRGDAE
ncbi:MAG: beta-ketoacyl synthase N-terminal-like domain-containing protein [Syntrophaceae bacterium]